MADDVFRGTGKPLTQQKFDEAVQRMSVDAATLWSLVSVETRGFGFLADRRPKILFERHIFHNRTGGAFDASHPEVSWPTPGGYSSSTGEYVRLATAISLNRTAALESASWGLGQVMGFNATGLGYVGSSGMVTTFLNGEDDQIEATVRFIVSNAALKAAIGNKKWATVAFYYNGENYAINNYDGKLAEFYAKYSKGPAPNIAVRTAQAQLLYAGFDPNGVDGVKGNGTAKALKAFQASKGIAASGELDDATKAALDSAVPFS